VDKPLFETSELMVKDARIEECKYRNSGTIVMYSPELTKPNALTSGPQRGNGREQRVILPKQCACHIGAVSARADQAAYSGPVSQTA